MSETVDQTYVELVLWLMRKSVALLGSERIKDEAIGGMIPIGQLAARIVEEKQKSDPDSRFDLYSTTMGILRVLALLDIIEIGPSAGKVTLAVELIPEEEVCARTAKITPFVVGAHLVCGFKTETGGWKVDELADLLGVSTDSIENYFRHLTLGFSSPGSPIKLGIRVYNVRGNSPRSGTYIRYEVVTE